MSLCAITEVSAVTISDDGEKTTLPDKTVTFIVTITNTDPYDLEVRVTCDDEFDPIIDPDDFTLGGGESKTVNFQLSIPPVTDPHLRESQLIVYSEASDAPIPSQNEDTHSLYTDIIQPQNEVDETTSSDDRSVAPIIIIGMVTTSFLLYLGAIRHFKIAGLAIAPLYMGERLTTSSLEEQTVRQQILNILTDRPGVTTSDLTRDLEVGRSTVRYHLNLLKDNDLLSEGPRGGWFPIGYDGLQLKEPQRRILVEIQNHGYTSTRDLAKRLGISRTALRYHIAKLVEGGWLTLPSS